MKTMGPLKTSAHAPSSFRSLVDDSSSTIRFILEDSGPEEAYIRRRMHMMCLIRIISTPHLCTPLSSRSDYKTEYERVRKRSSD